MDLAFKQSGAIDYRRLLAHSWREQANAYSIRASSLRCDLKPVIHRMAQILLAAQIPFRGLDRDMGEQELNLF